MVRYALLKYVLFCVCTSLDLLNSTKNSKKLTFFLYLPNANLNTDFLKYIAFGGFEATPTYRGKSNEYATLCPKLEIHWYWMPDKTYCHLLANHGTKRRLWDILTLYWTFVVTPSTIVLVVVVVVPSVEQPPTNLTYVIKSTYSYV